MNHTSSMDSDQWLASILTLSIENVSDFTSGNLSQPNVMSTISTVTELRIISK